jgi:hypothetical protein
VSYHDNAFLKRIDTTAGCTRHALPAGHWFMVDQAKLTVKLMAEFIDGEK